MKEYQLQGVHCANCAKRLEAQLQQLPHGEKSRLNFSTATLYLPNEADVKAAKKILNADKVMINIESKADESDAHHQGHHQHGHPHHHELKDDEEASAKMKLVFILNLFFAVGEFIFGTLFNSAAILSDAVHDLGDSLSIGLAWAFQKISTKEANEKYSFGHRRFSLLGALSTSVVLVVGSVMMIVHSVPLLFNPEPVHSQGMFWVAIAAIAVNGFATWLLSSGASANEKVLTLHMLEDVLGWVGVLLVSIVLRYRDWYFLDPLLSIAIASFILSRTIPSFLKIANVFLESVPEQIDIEKLEQAIYDIDSVHAVSHLHVWSIDGEENAFAVTVYVSTEKMEKLETIREDIRQLLKEYNVTHSTIEVVADIERIVQPQNTKD